VGTRTRNPELIQFSVRLSPDLAAEVERLAAREERAVGVELRRAIREYVERRKRS
jgi:predicted transcriptional regulator